MADAGVITLPRSSEKNKKAQDLRLGLFRSTATCLEHRGGTNTVAHTTMPYQPLRLPIGSTIIPAVRPTAPKPIRTSLSQTGNTMAEHFWTKVEGIRERLRMADDVTVRSYLLIGERQHDRTECGHRAASRIATAKPSSRPAFGAALSCCASKPVLSLALTASIAGRTSQTKNIPYSNGRPK